MVDIKCFLLTGNLVELDYIIQQVLVTLQPFF